jgi:hypothetical protein
MGGVSNVDIDENNTLHIKGIGVTISTFETLPSCPSAGRTATPVPPARYVPSPGSTCAGCGCPLESSTKLSPPPGPGMAVRRAASAINSGLASKGRSRRVCARLGCDARGVGACRKPTCNTWPLPRRSMWIGLWHGWTSGHGPRPGPPALRPLLLPALSIQTRQPRRVLAAHPQSKLCCPVPLTHILYYINVYSSK